MMSYVPDTLASLRQSGWIKPKPSSQDLSVLLVSLAHQFGLEKDLNKLCASLPFSADNAQSKSLDLINLLNAMTSLGYIGQKLTVNLQDLDHRLCPCLFVPEKGNNDNKDTFVILQKMEGKENTYLIHRHISDNPEEHIFDKPLKGTVWIFVPAAEHQDCLSETYRDAAGHTWFRALLGKFKSGFWPVFIIGLFLTLLALVAPLFVMTVYDKVIGGHAPEALYPLLAGAVLSLVIESVFRIVRAQALSWYGARLDYIVSTHIFERLLKLPVLFTERVSISAQIARVRAFDAVRSFFVGPQILALAELPFTIVLFAAISIIAGPLVFVPLVAAAFYVLLFFSVRPAIRTSMRLSSGTTSSRQEMMIETFEKIDSLRAGGLTSVWFREFRDRSGKASMAGFHASWVSSVLDSLSHMIYVTAGLAVVVIGVLQIWSGAMTAGALVAGMIMTWRVLAPIQILCNALPKLVQLQNAVTQINRLMRIETEDVNEKITARLDNPKGKVRFNKVGLRYTKDTDPVFTGLNFEAEAGQLVAVTGGNGSGKSTILKLMNGLYHPQVGSIHIDGIDIRQIDPQHLRTHVSYVPQSPNIFSGTLADNLRFANPLIDDETLKDALEEVDLWKYIENLPDGLSTPIGENGSHQIPNGLSYNVGLARAYVQETPVLLFDELPYAFLNSTAGGRFKEKLQSWKGNKTVILVTHREDYMSLADQVVLLRTGLTPIVDRPEEVIQAIYEHHKVAA